MIHWFSLNMNSWAYLSSQSTASYIQTISIEMTMALCASTHAYIIVVSHLGVGAGLWNHINQHDHLLVYTLLFPFCTGSIINAKLWVILVLKSKMCMYTNTCTPNCVYATCAYMYSACACPLQALVCEICNNCNNINITTSIIIPYTI